MYNMHLYFSLENLGKKVCIIYGKIWQSLICDPRVSCLLPAFMKLQQENLCDK